MSVYSQGEIMGELASVKIKFPHACLLMFMNPIYLQLETVSTDFENCVHVLLNFACHQGHTGMIKLNKNPAFQHSTPRKVLTETKQNLVCCNQLFFFTIPGKPSSYLRIMNNDYMESRKSIFLQSPHTARTASNMNAEADRAQSFANHVQRTHRAIISCKMSESSEFVDTLRNCMRKDCPRHNTGTII